MGTTTHYRLLKTVCCWEFHDSKYCDIDGELLDPHEMDPLVALQGCGRQADQRFQPGDRDKRRKSLR